MNWFHRHAPGSDPIIGCMRGGHGERREGGEEGREGEGERRGGEGGGGEGVAGLGSQRRKGTGGSEKVRAHSPMSKWISRKRKL